MQIFYVKHYLTPTGLSYFNDTWFPAVMNIMSKQSGYISCSHDHELDQGDCVNLTVKFDNEENVKKWATTPEHKVLVDGLDPYRLRGLFHYVATTDPTAERESLEWLTAEPSTPSGQLI